MTDRPAQANTTVDTSPPGGAAEPSFSARLKDRRKWPRRWWWPDEFDVADEDDDWQARHNEASNTIRRVIMTIIGYSFFCLFTLSIPDEELVKGKVKVPFANIEVGLIDFFVVGPLILIALMIYLQVFVAYWRAVPSDRVAQPLPYVFNMPELLPRLLSGFLFYWLAPVVLLAFLHTAGPLMDVSWLLLLTVAVTAILSGLQIKRWSTQEGQRRRWAYRGLWAVFVWFAILTVGVGWGQVGLIGSAAYRLTALYVEPVIVASLSWTDEPEASGEASLPSTSVPATGETVAPTPTQPLSPAFGGPSGLVRSAQTAQASPKFTRGLNLAGADLRKVDLSNRDLRGANLRGANLEGVTLRGYEKDGGDLTAANLSEASLRDADLQFVELEGANLSGADLAGANLHYVGLFRADLRRANVTDMALNAVTLREADLRGAIGLTCRQLLGSDDWQLAYRDAALACGAPIPKSPTKK